MCIWHKNIQITVFKAKMFEIASHIYHLPLEIENVKNFQVWSSKSSVMHLIAENKVENLI